MRAFRPDPAKLPGDAAEALGLARAIAPEPAALGAAFVPADPYEASLATWAVLDDDCAWQREPLPDGVLASLSRYLELPGAGGGEAPVRVMLVVTAHGSTESADGEVTTTLEEALRCPDQQLREGERVSDLTSLGTPAGMRGQNEADDQVYESGTYRSDVWGGPHAYIWAVNRIGPLTMGVSVNGTETFGRERVAEVVADALELMGAATEEALR